MEVVTDTECQERMKDVNVSQSLLCAGGDSKGACVVSFLSNFLWQHFLSLCDLCRATAGVL